MAPIPWITLRHNVKLLFVKACGSQKLDSYKTHETIYHRNISHYFVHERTILKSKVNTTLFTTLNLPLEITAVPRTFFSRPSLTAFFSLEKSVTDSPAIFYFEFKVLLQQTLF